jgi:hypothetical protein
MVPWQHERRRDSKGGTNAIRTPRASVAGPRCCFPLQGESGAGNHPLRACGRAARPGFSQTAGSETTSGGVRVASQWSGRVIATCLVDSVSETGTHCSAVDSRLWTSLLKSRAAHRSPDRHRSLPRPSTPRPCPALLKFTAGPRSTTTDAPQRAAMRYTAPSSDVAYTRPRPSWPNDDSELTLRRVGRTSRARRPASRAE